MSATDIAKDILRIANTASMTRDVIDLMEKKLALLTQEVADLTSKNTGLVAQVSQLEADKKNLESKIQQLTPKGNVLDQQSRDILKFFFNRACDLSARDIERRFQLATSVSDYHIDILMGKKFIGQTQIGSDSDSCFFAIKKEGRNYIMSDTV